MTILTISSQVIFGHVGNSVADFALRRLGHRVIAVPTVLLSNHKGYPDAVGEVFGPDLLREFFAALDRRGVLDELSAVQTGFLATVGQAQSTFDFLDELRTGKPDLPIIVDPVMGDKGRLYVDPALPGVYRERTPSLASLITPNAFEAVTLLDQPAPPGLEALAAGLSGLGFGAGAVTSAETLLSPPIAATDTTADTATAAETGPRAKAIFTFDSAETKRIDHEGVIFPRDPNGVGDFVAALSAGLYPLGSLAERTGWIAEALVRLLKATADLGSGELALAEAQDSWLSALPQAAFTRATKA